MSKRQDKLDAFVGSYCANGNNATQAAKDAGYSEKTAYSQGQRLLKNVEVQEAIKKNQQRTAQKYEITKDSLLKKLDKAYDAALSAETPQSSAAVAAVMGQAKLCGLDKQVIDHKSSDGSMSPKAYSIIAYKEAQKNLNGELDGLD